MPKQKYLKTAAMIFIQDPTVTGANASTQDWTTFQLLTTAPMRIGSGWETYRTALMGRGVTPGIDVTVTNATDLFTATAHGLLDGTQIRIYTRGSGIPGNTTGGTDYFVRDATANDFKVSLTLGGGVHNLTSDGNLVVVSTGQVGAFVELPGSGGAYPLLQVMGQDGTAHFCSLFDRVYIGHAPSKEYLRKVKHFSKRKTEIGIYFFQFDSVSQAGTYNTWFDTFDNLLAPANIRLGAAEPPSPPVGWPAGCLGNDHWEDLGDGATGFATTCGGQNASNAASAHTWLIDVGGTTLVNNNNADTGWAATIRILLGIRYDRGEVDCILIDNANAIRFANQSDNYVDEGAGYANGYRAMFNSAQRTIGRQGAVEVGGNGAGWVGKTDIDLEDPAHPIVTATYTAEQVGSRFEEFAFTLNGAGTGTQPFSTWRTNLRKIKNHGITSMILGQVVTTTAASYNTGGRTDHDRWFSNSNSPIVSAKGVTLTPAATSAGGTAGALPGSRGPGVLGGVDLGDWERLRTMILSELDCGEQVYVMTARTGSANPATASMYIFHDPVMGPVV